MRDVLVVKSNSSLTADILTSVSETSAAGVRDFISAHRTLIAGSLYDFDHIGIRRIPAHRELNTIREYSPLLINATPHSRRLSRYYPLRNSKQILEKRIIPRLPCNLTQHLILQMLHLRIKLSDLCHSNSFIVCVAGGGKLL